MNGMEMMAVSLLQKMTGLSPDEMKELAEKAISLLKSLDERLITIENDVKAIRAYTDEPVSDNVNSVKQLESSNDGQDS